MYKSIDDINECVRDGSVRVVIIKVMLGVSEKLGMYGALRKVDAVATGTSGTMISCIP
ncbi:MAG: hypothetical protein LBH02_01615 [Methanocalculaceae archaeon]|jgi:uncharacterized protein (DUF39 family)|nr:hypothetical protein [Methanocalculaceae archaeon]